MNLFGALAHLGADMERASIWKLNQLNAHPHPVCQRHSNLFRLSVTYFDSFPEVRGVAVLLAGILAEVSSQDPI